MVELVLAIISTAALLVAGAKVFGVRSKERNRPLVPCRPSNVILGATTVRYIFGGWVVVIMGRLFGTPDGEYGQYIVTFEQGLYSIIVWSTCLCMGMATYRVAAHWYWPVRMTGDMIMSRDWLDRKVSAKKIEYLFWISLSLKLGYVLMSSVLGSEDRGSDYTYWALIDWKPTAVFISISRILDLCYVLAPLIVKNTRSVLKRLVCVTGIGLTIGLMSLWGGRGEVLYPVVYMGIGSFGVVTRRMLVKICSLVVMVCVITVPVLSALRDTPGYEKVSGLERIALLGRLKEADSTIMKRVKTIGREIYACSDGYIFQERDNKGVGFGKVGVFTIFRHGTPRILGGTPVKSDGSLIAQSYMRSDVKDWFPCITFPADAFRRFRWLGVIVGSCLAGLVILMVDRAWLTIRTKGGSAWALLLVLLPVTLIRTAPTGTLKEVIGIYPWEVIKYSVVCGAIGYCIDRLAIIGKDVMSLTRLL